MAGDLNFSRPMILLGATSIVGYNMVIRDRGVVGVVTARSRLKAVHGWPRLALQDSDEIRKFFEELPPDAVIIYCDAVCDVSKCENNPAWAREINIENLRRTLDVMRDDVRLVYVSSDHVFGDDGAYDEDAETCPVSLYGAIRAEAEQLALSRPETLLIRTGLPIGSSVDGKSGHLEWLCYQLKSGLPVTIIEDESRTAMPTTSLADRIIDLAISPVTGIRHITATRLVSRVELAQTFKDYFQLPGELELSQRAKQPAPHLGRIHLITRYTDPLAEALQCPLDIRESFIDLTPVRSDTSMLRAGVKK